MKILITTEEGQTINLEVENSSETIAIKIRGETTRQIDLDLTPGSVSGSGPVQGTAIKLFVSTLKGKTFKLDVNGSETIEQVKNMIHSQGGPPVNKQRLIFQGKQLEDHRTIADYNIKTDANLVIMSALCGC